MIESEREDSFALASLPSSLSEERAPNSIRAFLASLYAFVSSASRLPSERVLPSGIERARPGHHPCALERDPPRSQHVFWGQSQQTEQSLERPEQVLEAKLEGAGEKSPRVLLSSHSPLASSARQRRQLGWRSRPTATRPHRATSRIQVEGTTPPPCLIRKESKCSES